MIINGTTRRGSVAASTAAARRHVGDDTIRALKWLVGVVATDATFEKRVAELSTRGSALNLEVAALVQSDPTIFSDWKLEEMRDAWNQVKYAIELLGAGSEGCALKISGEVECFLSRTPRFAVREKNRDRVTFDRKFARMGVHYQGGSLPIALLLRVKDIIEAEGARVARCDSTECGRLFVKRKRGMFCSTKCMDREKKRVWRERHSSLAALVHKRRAQKAGAVRGQQ